MVVSTQYVAFCVASNVANSVYCLIHFLRFPPSLPGFFFTAILSAKRDMVYSLVYLFTPFTPINDSTAPFIYFVFVRHLTSVLACRPSDGGVSSPIFQVVTAQGSQKDAVPSPLCRQFGAKR